MKENGKIEIEMTDMPRIKWKRKVNLNSGSYRINIPQEIVEAYKIEKGQELEMYVEDGKLVVQLI